MLLRYIILLFCFLLTTSLNGMRKQVNTIATADSMQSWEKTIFILHLPSASLSAYSERSIYSKSKWIPTHLIQQYAIGEIDSTYAKIYFGTDSAYLTLKDIRAEQYKLGGIDSLKENYIDNLLNRYNLLSIEERQMVAVQAQVLGLFNFERIQAEVQEEIGRLRKYGLGIIDWELTESDGGIFTGINIDLMNLAKKTIKYVWIIPTGYNDVNDIVPLRKNRLRGIGPILSNETASYRFELVWPTDIVTSAKLALKVQYMDGSIRSYSTTKNLILKERVRKIIESGLKAEEALSNATINISLSY